MTRIIASYVVWNEEQLIAESIRSLAGYVDGFVFVDSAFTSNPVDVAHSTDRTRVIAEDACGDLPCTYIESQVKMRLEAARNWALMAVKEGDWAFVVDGDETLLGARNELLELFAAIRLGEISEPVGVSVYTAALLSNGHAPDITPAQYGRLPVIYTRGVQPRLVPAQGSTWQRVPNGKSYGLYRGGLVRAPADPRLLLVNHRTRQTFAAYQHDYVWESAL